MKSAWLALLPIAAFSFGTVGACGGTSETSDTSRAGGGAGAQGGSVAGSANEGGSPSSAGMSQGGASAVTGGAGSAGEGSLEGGAAGQSNVAGAGGAAADACGGCDPSAQQICVFQQGGPGPSHFVCAKQNPCGAAGACACIVNQGQCQFSLMGDPPGYCVCNNGLK